MRLGIFAKTFEGVQPDPVLHQAAAAGYAAVQYNMACSGIGSLPVEIPQAAAEAVATAARTNRVAIAAVSATYNMLHPDPAQRAQGRAAFTAIAAKARAMGTNLVTLCTGSCDAADQWRHHPENDTAAAWQEMLREFEILLPLAEKHDIILGVEPELANAVSSAAKARRLLDTLRSDRIKIVLDPANLFETEADRPSRDIIAEAVQLLADSIILAHAKDRLPDGKFTTAGNGVIDFGRYFADLRAAGFSGTVVTHGLAAEEAPGRRALSAAADRSGELTGMFRVAGALLNVADTGGDGMPFVFQHGLGGDAGQTAEVFPANSGRRLITLECRGHGRSEAGPETAFSLVQFCDDLGSMIESTLSGPVDIGGISMGAAITLMLAIRKPEIVKSLVIARPAWRLDMAPPNMQANAAVGELLARHDPVTALDMFNRSTAALDLERNSPDNLASLRGFFTRPNPKVLATLLTRISADGPRLTAADLGRLTIPALVIGTDCRFISIPSPMPRPSPR